jgi:hypothetical protein
MSTVLTEPGHTVYIAAELFVARKYGRLSQWRWIGAIVLSKSQMPYYIS